MNCLYVDRFERGFAQWLGVRHAFAFWRGRVALYAILRALDIGPNDEVVLTGYTCIAVARPIKYVGAKPIYVDIEPVTYCMAPELLEERISSKTRLIIAQHTFGYVADMERIAAIAEAKKVPVVEDACLAVGSSHQGRPAGTMSLAAYWSGQWNKHFTTGLGGWVTTASDTFADRLRETIEAEASSPSVKENLALGVQRAGHRVLAFPRMMSRTEALYHWLSKKGLLPDHSLKAKDVPVRPPRFFRTMGRGQAKAGLRHLRRLEANLQHRRQLTRLYEQLLRARGWPVAETPTGMDPALVRCPLRVADKARAVEMARDRHLEVGTWFDCPLHQVRTDLEVYDYHPGMCPVAEEVSRQIVNLPLHPRVNERMVRDCVDLVCEIGPAGPLEASTRQA